MIDPVPDPSSGPARAEPSLTRRRLLAGTGALIAGMAIPSWVTAGDALAADQATLETMAGLVAWVVPGDDAYSRQQGISTATPGGIAAGGAAALAYTLDEAIPIPAFQEFDISVPGAQAIALLVGLYATTVNPWAGWGPFPQPFPNLSAKDKGETMKRLEADKLLMESPLRYAINALPTLAALAAFGERGVLDTSTKPHRLTKRPVGWDLSGYAGVSDGWPELVGSGYWKDRTHADDDPVTAATEAGG